jgi:hypothetical protein
MIASKTPTEFKADAAKHDSNAAESFERCDTDGFLSQWASGINAQVARTNAAIAENGGVATFWVYEVTDLDGKPLTFRRANTQFGFKLVVDVNGREVWIDPHAVRPSTNVKKGVKVGRREFEAAAHANTWSPPGARGLSGASSVTVRIFPDDRDVKWDGVTL